MYLNVIRVLSFEREQKGLDYLRLKRLPTRGNGWKRREAGRYFVLSSKWRWQELSQSNQAQEQMLVAIKCFSTF
jgi:hypothetical protein